MFLQNPTGVTRHRLPVVSTNKSSQQNPPWTVRWKKTATTKNISTWKGTTACLFSSSVILMASNKFHYLSIEMTRTAAFILDVLDVQYICHFRPSDGTVDKQLHVLPLFGNVHHTLHGCSLPGKCDFGASCVEISVCVPQIPVRTLAPPVQPIQSEEIYKPWLWISISTHESHLPT